MIITVALNPALDQTVEVEHFDAGDTNRVLAMRFDIGGKGINIARALNEIGVEALATGFAPGARGRQIIEQLQQAGIPCEFVDVPGETRTNITILDRGTHTHSQLALPGPTMERESYDQLIDVVRGRLRPGDWLVLAGSIPPPGDAVVYSELIALATECGASTALDADGPVVEAVLACGVRPTVLKLNDHEVGRLTHLNVEDEDDAFMAARRVHERGVTNVIVTRGADGALAVTPAGDFLVRPPKVEVVSAVGAGDAFLSGLLCGIVKGQDWEHALTLASAAAAATCLTPGTQMCAKADIWRLRPLAVATCVRERLAASPPASAVTR